MKEEFDVVAACIRKSGKVLLAQRNPDDDFPLLWEFPGGKVEKGETYQQALKREIKEELALDIEVGRLISVFHDEIPSLKIKVFLYEVVCFKGEAQVVECKDWAFLTMPRIGKMPLSPVDRKIYEYLLNHR